MRRMLRDNALGLFFFALFALALGGQAIAGYSEFLAVGTMVAFSIYLRQRGSAESKPVGAAHDESAVESE